MDFVQKNMRLPIHRNSLYLLRPLGSPEIIALRGDRKRACSLDVDPLDLNFIRDRLDRFLPEPIFIPIGGRAAFLIASIYPICGILELLILEIPVEKVIASVRSGSFGAIVHHERLDCIEIDNSLSRHERDMVIDAAGHIRVVMSCGGIIERVDATRESERVLEFLRLMADFVGVELETERKSAIGVLDNCDRNLITAFVMTVLLFSHCRTKRRRLRIELSAVASRLWLTFVAECMDPSALNEFEPLRKSTILRDGCMRFMHERGYIKIELCAHRTDASRIGLKQNPELIY